MALNMEFTPLQSSNVKAAAWLANTLFVDFHNGRRYKYDDVPEEVFQGLVRAESPGKYFHAEIRARFETSLVDAQAT